MTCKICHKEIVEDKLHISSIPTICWECYEPTMGNETSLSTVAYSKDYDYNSESRD